METDTNEKGKVPRHSNKKNVHKVYIGKEQDFVI